MTCGECSDPMNSCDRKTGTCKACQPGFTGEKCDQGKAKNKIKGNCNRAMIKILSPWLQITIPNVTEKIIKISGNFNNSQSNEHIFTVKKHEIGTFSLLAIKIFLFQNVWLEPMALTVKRNAVTVLEHATLKLGFAPWAVRLAGLVPNALKVRQHSKALVRLSAFLSWNLFLCILQLKGDEMQKSDLSLTMCPHV